MKQACQGQLLPKITYTPVRFAVVEHASEWASPWGQAASLLQALAEFPRKALADRFFFRDLEAVDDDAVVEAMDLCEDAVRKISNRRDSKQQAKEDLRFLARLSRSQNDARSRCDLIVRLIGGAKAKVLSVEVRDEETT